MDVFRVGLCIFIVLILFLHELRLNCRLIFFFVGSQGLLLHDSVGLGENSMIHSIFVDLSTFEAVAEEIVPRDAFEVIFHEYKFH